MDEIARDQNGGFGFAGCVSCLFGLAWFGSLELLGFLEDISRILSI